jgi:hypothetical protein
MRVRREPYKRRFWFRRVPRRGLKMLTTKKSANSSVSLNERQLRFRFGFSNLFMRFFQAGFAPSLKKKYFFQHKKSLEARAVFLRDYFSAKGLLSQRARRAQGVTPTTVTPTTHNQRNPSPHRTSPPPSPHPHPHPTVDTTPRQRHTAGALPFPTTRLPWHITQIATPLLPFPTDSSVTVSPARSYATSPCETASRPFVFFASILLRSPSRSRCEGAAAPYQPFGLQHAHP